MNTSLNVFVCLCDCAAARFKEELMAFVILQEWVGIDTVSTNCMCNINISVVILS